MPVFIDKLYGVSFADDAAGVGDDGGIARVFIEEIPDFLADPSVAIGIAFIQRPSTSALFGAMEEIAGERCADAAIVLRRERPIMPCGSGDVAAHLTSHATEPVTAYGRCGIVARTLLAARSELATAIAIFIACAARISARCELKATAADVDIARLAATALTEVSILEAEAMRPAIREPGWPGSHVGSASQLSVKQGMQRSERLLHRKPSAQLSLSIVARHLVRRRPRHRRERARRRTPIANMRS